MPTDIFDTMTLSPSIPSDDPIIIEHVRAAIALLRPIAWPPAESIGENYDPRERRWWVYGEYIAGGCPKCSRSRLMQCVDNLNKKRIICEKCKWEPQENSYCYEALD
jgi:hypothetical protein